MLQRKWKQSLAAVALLLALGPTPALAATINVGSGCSLVNAINSANQDASVGGCAAGSDADTNVLSAGSTHTLTVIDNSPYGPTGLPVIDSVIITIAGNGSTITRGSGAPDFRILAVSSTGDLTIQQTTVSGGVAAFGGYKGVRGGGMFNNGTLTLTDSTVSGNSAARRGGGLSSLEYDFR